MKRHISIAIFTWCLLLSTSSSADLTSKTLYFLRVFSTETGAIHSYPPDTETIIPLLPEIQKEWDCLITKETNVNSNDIYGSYKFRSINCFHKDLQGFYAGGVVANAAKCYSDKIKRGTEIAHLDIAMVSVNKNFIKSMSIDLLCEAK